MFSLARRHGPEAVFRKRAVTAAVDELGHSHCEDPHCVMRFFNTLVGEFDSRVVWAC
ncbi:MAG TPA: hypothetical protein VLE54_08450 [Thermoanaerobaculia bacterium]|nr:hypothetical protein [Thermoanaerobaculia bacterium]